MAVLKGVMVVPSLMVLLLEPALMTNLHIGDVWLCSSFLGTVQCSQLTLHRLSLACLACWLQPNVCILHCMLACSCDVMAVFACMLQT